MEKWYLIVIVARVLSQVAAQGMDNIVNEAMTSVFRNAPGGGRSPMARFGPIGANFERQIEVALRQIPASRNFGGGVASRLRSDQGSGASRMLYRFSQSYSPASNILLSDRSMMASMVSKRIAESIGGTDEAYRSAAQSPKIAASFRRAFDQSCYEIPQCDPWDPYRRTDGQCNNLDEPLLGSSSTPQQRIVPAAYDNYIDLPRVRSVIPFERLPSARTVSNNILQHALGDKTLTSSTFSTYLTHHGQFIDHDIISTPTETAGTMENPMTIGDCCFPRSEQVKPEACFNIYVEQPDPFYPPNHNCMNFVRRTGAPPLNCENGVRQQINQNTAFVDGSAIYGSDSTLERDLRLFEHGKLKEDSQNLLPPPPTGCPAEVMTNHHCFLAGDNRPSETPPLTVMHITWLRRHNLIADALREATGIIDDETLFQEAKRIVVAELQHVTYNEFLLEVLDKKHMNDYNLRSTPLGHAEVYNHSIDPRTINAFGVAAYRMGHTLVRNSVGYDRGFGKVREFPMSQHFERPDLMFNHGYEYMARWMSRAPKARSDRFLVDGMRNRLFECPPMTGTHPSETLAFDLGALNIQRGRDHGIPSYNAYRQFCGFYRANFFAAVRGGLDFHSREAAASLQRTYRHVDDIDLFAGGISETPVPGSILGPTFQCLIAFQFSLYKHGDRFWYERTFPENPVAAFTPAELAQIKHITYSKIMCSAVKNIGNIIPSFQPNLMIRPDVPGNGPVPCHLLLQGSPLGFDITPFAQELLQLGGRRRRGPFASRPSPLNPGMRGIIQLKGPGSDSDNFMAPMNGGRAIRTGRRKTLY